MRASVRNQGRRFFAGGRSPHAVPVAPLGLVASAPPVPRHRDRGPGAARHANCRQVVHRDVHSVRDGVLNPVVHRQRKRERGVRRQGRSGERRSGGACGTESHRRPRGLAPGISERPVLGIGAGAAVERHRRAFVHRLVRPGVRRRRVVVGGHRDVHRVRGGDGSRARGRHRQRESESGRGLEVRSGEGRSGGPAGQTHRRSRGLAPGIYERTVSGIGAGAAVERHRRALGHRLVRTGVRRRRVAVHRDVHRVRGGVLNPVVHRQRKREDGVGGHVRGGEGRTDGACGTESHRRGAARLAPRVGQRGGFRVGAGTAVERHRRALVHRLVGPGARRRRVVIGGHRHGDRVGRGGSAVNVDHGQREHEFRVGGHVRGGERRTGGA